MSSLQESGKSLPTVEASQKYMSWHLKEINQSLKDLCTIFRSMDLAIKTATGRPQVKVDPKSSDEIPF